MHVWKSIRWLELGNVGKWINSHWEIQKKKMQFLIGCIRNNLHLLIRVLRYQSKHITELSWEVGLKIWNLYPTDAIILNMNGNNNTRTTSSGKSSWMHLLKSSNKWCQLHSAHIAIFFLFEKSKKRENSERDTLQLKCWTYYNSPSLSKLNSLWCSHC